MPKNSPVVLDTGLDPVFGTKPNGDALYGSGNPGDHAWAVQAFDDHYTKHHVDHDYDGQLGMYVGYRTGDAIQPSEVRHGDELYFTAPAGHQVVDPAHNVSAEHTGRAVTNTAWSFEVSNMTIEQFLAEGGDFIFKADTDPGKGVKWGVDLHAVWDPTANPGGSHVVFEDKNGNIVINDDAGNEHVTQNSQNSAFWNSLIDTDSHTKGIQPGAIGTPGQYDYMLEMIDPAGHVIAKITEHMTLTDHPLLA